MNTALPRKYTGAYYTPDSVVHTLVGWAVRSEADRLLDPACGDGRFIAAHKNSVGIEQDTRVAHTAIERAPWALVHEGDFFAWASQTSERFTVASGNPPFIRYQTFKGEARERALSLCRRLGVRFNGLTSSWAPFIVAAASLLERGGRMAFVVPGEIGHAPYAAPVLEYLAANFDIVHIVAVRDRLFPELSEDCWLLYADGFGGGTTEFRFSPLTRFQELPAPPVNFRTISLHEWQRVWMRRLRPLVLPTSARELYLSVLRHVDTRRLMDIARIDLGYVSGHNGFFHLTPSEALRWEIPSEFLRPTVRRAEYLPPRWLTPATVRQWYRADEEMLLLAIPKSATELPAGIRKYLATNDAMTAKASYKCQNRHPWYSVPDIRTPELFLSYMSGRTPSLVRNDASCTSTNSIHGMRFHTREGARSLGAVWNTEFLRLSCELAGHPLGGGMLKLEPGEAAQILVPSPSAIAGVPAAIVGDAVATMRAWRHYANESAKNRQLVMPVDRQN